MEGGVSSVVDPKSFEEIGKLVQEHRSINAPMATVRRVDVQAQLEVLYSTLQFTDKLNRSTDILLRVTRSLFAVTVTLLVLTAIQVLLIILTK